MSSAEFARRYPDVRGAIGQLLELLDRLDIQATWAVVGHLFLPSCARDAAGRAHPELIRPSYAWYRRDWLGSDPCTDRQSDPMWYGDDIVRAIRASRVAHEIASHSFSHAPFGDPGCSRDCAASDIRLCQQVAEGIGVQLRSFVFPRNLEGHLDVLVEHGFTAYRGTTPSWYSRLPTPLSRAAHLADQVFGLTPPVVEPKETLSGLWNIPASMLFLHRAGIRRFIPMTTRVIKAKRGLQRAVATNRILHLWLHPFNLTVDREVMFAGLDAVLSEASRLRASGDLRIATMGEVARECATK